MKPTIKTIYVDKETGEQLTKEHVSRGIYVKEKCKKEIKKFGFRIEIHYLWVCTINNQTKLQL